MSNIYSSKDAVSYLKNFQQITETYQEIAATRMQRVKHSVLQNREYLEETRSIYHEVVHSYKEYMTQRKSMEQTTSSEEKKHKVCILLSANTKLYGGIIKKVFDSFYSYVKETDTDIIIAGKTGLQMYKATQNPKPYHFFDIPDDIITPEALADIIVMIKQYSEISVFHVQFEDILTQVVKKTAITPETAYKANIEEQGSIGSLYIFEPAIETVLQYFEKEILGSLFVQTVNESNLSKFTARMITLNTTNTNIDQRIQELTQSIKLLEHSIINRKQQEQLASFSLWS